MNEFDSLNDMLSKVHLDFKQCLHDLCLAEKSDTFTKSFKLTTIERFGESVTFLCQKRWCKHCFKNEWTFFSVCSN